MYKTTHGWLYKVIHRELCKKFIFDHRDKWHMLSSEPILENATHKIILDFDILINHLISARRSNILIINHPAKREFEHREKLKESKSKQSTETFLENTKVMMLLIVIKEFNTVSKGLV